MFNAHPSHWTLRQVVSDSGQDTTAISLRTKMLHIRRRQLFERAVNSHCAQVNSLQVRHLLQCVLIASSSNCTTLCIPTQHTDAIHHTSSPFFILLCATFDNTNTAHESDPFCLLYLSLHHVCSSPPPSLTPCVDNSLSITLLVLLSNPTSKSGPSTIDHPKFRSTTFPQTCSSLLSFHSTYKLRTFVMTAFPLPALRPYQFRSSRTLEQPCISNRRRE